MNVKEVDKLAAQFAVSVSETNNLIASWMGGDDTPEAESEKDDETYNLKPLNARAGLGSKGKVHETSLNNSNSARALQIIKKRMDQRKRAERGELPAEHRPSKPKPQSKAQEDDEEESKSEIVSKRKAQTSFLDSYRASKKKKKKSKN